jgi:steroid 5-alpha reductase family enzyme
MATELAHLAERLAGSVGLSMPSDPILSGAVLSVLLLIAFCWVSSVVLRNYSIVDRLWSLIPVFHVWYFIFAGLAETQTASLLTSSLTLWSFLAGNPRLVLMGVLSLLWGARLSFNYARKGGYAWGAEDYRWVMIRKELNNEFLFQLLNLVFTAFIQNVLLFLIAFPAYFALRSAAPLTACDAAAAALFLFCFATETAADAQQWCFYERRTAMRSGSPAAAHALAQLPPREAADLRRGYATTGLFAWSRHPNFCAEVSLWWSFALFAVAAALAPVTVPSYPFSLFAIAFKSTVADTYRATLPLLGAAGLTMLFNGSTWLTERISASKYPTYKQYQAAVPRLLPIPVGEDPFPESIDALLAKNK